MYITENVPMIDIGSAKLGMIVADQLRRNRKMTPTTSTSVSSSVNVTSSTEALIVADRSYNVDTVTAGGISVCRRTSAALTLLATSTVFVPGCRWMASTIERDPLYQLAVLLFCTSSVMRPISERWTGAPLR